MLAGKRHAYRTAAGVAQNRAAMPFTQTAVDCEEGTWRGEFAYPSGAKEAFLFRKPNAGEL